MDEQFEKIYKKTENFGRTQFVREIQKQINENKKLKQSLKEIKKIINDCKQLMPHEFDWEEQADNILEIIEKLNL